MSDQWSRVVTDHTYERIIFCIREYGYYIMHIPFTLVICIYSYEQYSYSITTRVLVLPLSSTLMYVVIQ